MKNVATGRGIMIYPKLISGPTAIQTQDTWLRASALLYLLYFCGL